jgi:non-homologous end joining protein Ku
MARAIWTGSISFGLVTIPVKLLPAVRADEEVHFHCLHKKDRGRLKNVRTCQVCGEEVPWSETVRGFEYEKGAFVVLSDEEWKNLRPEATQAVEIQAFVDRLRAGRGSSWSSSATRTRSSRRARSISPPAKEKTAPGERKAASMLIEAMTRPFVAEDYVDDYEKKLRAALEARADATTKGGRAPAPASSRPPKATNVVDLVEVLKRSLANAPASKKHRGAKRGSRTARPAARRAS